MKTKGFILFCMVLGLFAFRYASVPLVVTPPFWPKPFYEKEIQQFTPLKIELGRALFYDPILSRNNTISCASCHSQYTAFTHVDHDLSHGIYDRIGTRNSPALMNLAWQKILMWDGAINHLDVQALAPIHHKDEMDETITHVVQKLQASSLYPQKFQAAFGDSVITGEHTLKALSQFMLTLVSCNSKYDQVKNEKAQFTTQEQNGYRLFQLHCSSCHTEPLFTNNTFQNNGLPVDTTLNDLGRYTVTKNAADKGLFKVPTLRNIEFSYPYMHDGRFKKLSQVMNHYTTGLVQSATLATELKQPIPLSSNEKVDVIAFLLTLTDQSFLFDTAYAYPKSFFMSQTKGRQ
jgi:cytochrome c peroxidase